MSNPDKLISKLKGIVGEAHIIQDTEKLKDYALDAKVPKAVVSPGTIDEISEIVAYANAERLVIIP